MKRNVGRLGEGFFQQLCDDTPGLSCNRSLVDERGWDFLVEFPMEPPYGLPLDMQPPPLSTFVQVKSTEGHRLSCRLKLLNALRFSLRPEPCFLVFFAYDAARREPAKAYVRHFWSPLIEQTVRAVREAEELGRTDLHAIRISVSFDKSHEVALGSLPSRMKEQIDDIKGDYAQEKGRLAHFSGIDEGLGPCGIEFAEDVTDDDLVDLALGLRASVPVNRLAPHSTRFGITLPLNRMEMGPGELSLEVKPATSATLVLSIPSSTDIALSVEIFTPSAIPWIKYDRVRYRIKGAFLDFVFHPQSQKTQGISVDLADQTWLSIRDFEGLLRLWTSWRGRVVGSQVWVQGQMAMWGSLQLPPAGDGDSINGWSSHLLFLQHFLREASYFAEDVTLTQRQMIDASGDIHDFLTLTYSPTFKAGGVNDELPTEGAIYRIIYPVAAQVGEFFFCCLVSRLGTALSDEDGRVELSMSEPSYLASYILRTDDEQNVRSQLLSDLEQRADSFEEEVPTIILADPVLGRKPDRPTG